MNKKLFIVFGKANSRKSSMIRCLTGAGQQQDNWMIGTENGNEDFLVCVTSPQDKNGTGISPAETISLFKKTNCRNIITALQSQSSSDHPNGEVYLKAFVNAGFEIQVIACLDPDANTLNLEGSLIENSNTRPDNEMASILRPLWNLI